MHSLKALSAIESYSADSNHKEAAVPVIIKSIPNAFCIWDQPSRSKKLKIFIINFSFASNVEI